MFNLSNNFPSRGNTFVRKLILPAMLITSVGLYLQQSTWESQNNRKKLAQKMIANIPLDIKNLKEFTPFEINAITRRNTIKNKLIGRKNFKSQNQPPQIVNTTEKNSENKNHLTNLNIERSLSENSYAKSEPSFGINSIYSTISDKTESSES